MADSFRLTPQALKRQRQIDNIQTALSLAVIFASLIYLTQQEGYTVEKVLLGSILLLGLVGLIRFRITGQPVKNSPLHLQETYELIIDENSVALKEANSFRVIIKHDKIKQIDDYGRHGIVVSAGKEQRIHVPIGLSQYEEVKAQLASWSRFRKIPFADFYALPPFLFVFIAYALAYLSQQLSSVAAAIIGSMAIGAVFSASFLHLKNPLVKKQDKSDGCFMLPVLFISLATVVPLIIDVLR
jgi:hypothetical protein